MHAIFFASICTLLSTTSRLAVAAPYDTADPNVNALFTALEAELEYAENKGKESNWWSGLRRRRNLQDVGSYAPTLSPVYEPTMMPVPLYAPTPSPAYSPSSAPVYAPTVTLT